MITVAGSGPSASQIDRVTVATKKRSTPADYVFCRFPFFYNRWSNEAPLMVYYNRGFCTCGMCGECKTEKYVVDSDYWDAYYRQYTTPHKIPARGKPSTGLCAVFAVVERWEPETIGLIGFDWVLDGNPDWEHDAQAERACILSLVNVRDLRNDTTLHRL